MSVCHPLTLYIKQAKKIPLDNDSDNVKRNLLDKESDNENNITSDNDYNPSSTADSNDSDNDEPFNKSETTQRKRGSTGRVRGRRRGRGGRGRGGRGCGNAQQAQPAFNVWTRIPNSENYQCPNKDVQFLDPIELLWNQIQSLNTFFYYFQCH